MKKLFTFLMTAVFFIPMLTAQNPESIYISMGSMTGKTIPYSDSDAQLKPTSDGVYVGVVKAWQKQNYKDQYVKFYSISDDVMSVYGQSGKTSAVMLGLTNISTTPISYALGIQTVNFDSTENGYLNSGSCGFWVSASAEATTNVEVTINLNDSTITFSEASDVPEIVIPTLQSVSPETGTTVTPASDGSVTITVTFSSEVKSLEAIVDGTDINQATKEVWNGSSYDSVPTGWDNNITSNSDGTVWTLIVPSELISQGTTEDGGNLKLTILNVKSPDNLLVSFEGDKTQLVLDYLVKGVSKTATLNITGNEENVLTVYESIAVEEEDVQYLSGVGTVYIAGDTFEFPISTVHRFLFTVPEGYEVAVSCSTLSQSSTTYTTGNEWTQVKVVDEEDESDNAEITFNNVMEGVYLNAFDSAIGATFNVAVTKANVVEGMFLSGAFNSYNPNGDSTYQLQQDTDMEDDADIVNQYTVYYEMPANQFSLNIVYGNKYLIPASGKNTPVTFTQEGYYMTATLPYAEGLDNAANKAVYWTNSAWTEAAEVAILVDTDAKTISFQYDAPVDDTVWWVRGAFNNYNPGSGSTWALNQQTYALNGEETNGLYAGQFNIPAGELSFNLKSPTGDVYCPYDEYEAGATTYFEFTDGEYVVQNTPKSGLDEAVLHWGYAYPEYPTDATSYWVNQDWKGGVVCIGVDGDAGYVKVSLPEVYIYGEFNEYTPNLSSEWKFNQGDAEDGEDNIYIGYFQIPEGQFKFNLRYGYNFLVPASDGNVTFSDNEYTGSFTEGTDAYWTASDFEGGQVYVKVDMTAKTVQFQIIPEQEDVWYLRCAANEYKPDGSADWALNPVEGEEGVYSGRFEFDDTNFSFNLLAPAGNVFVPINADFVPEATEIVFTNLVYTGSTDYAIDETEEAMYWTYPAWGGGYATIKIEPNAGTITITAEDESSTEVTDLKTLSKDDVIYNLQGVRVSKPSKGIFIINGKKVLVK